MARKKNSTFVGSPMADVDVDSLIYKRWIEAAVGDTALVQDKLTGLNGEIGTIVHTGAAGRGCVLGVPIVNQALRASASFTTGGKTAGATRLFCLPIFVPLGEEQIVVETQGYFDPEKESIPVFWQVRSTAYASISTQVAQLHERVTLAVTPGSVQILECLTDTDQWSPGTSTLSSLHVHFGRVGSGSPAILPASSPLTGQSPQTSADAVYKIDFDDQLFASQMPVSGRTATLLNRQQNSLLEFLTGWPSGNAAYAQIDSGTANPTTSRFHAATRAGTDLAAEGELQFPLLAAVFGAAMTDGSFAVNAAQPPTTGMLDWYAPWVLTTAALPQNAFVQRIKMPDFQSASSRLKAVAIGTKGPSWDAAKPWQANFSCGGASVTSIFTDVGGGSNLVIATASAIAFTGDANANCVVALTRAAGARAIEEFALLGVAFYFEP